MEVEEWKTTGEIIGRLYDGDGATLPNTVAAVDTKFTSGGIAFRSFSSTKHFDTVELRSAPAASSMGMEALAAWHWVTKPRHGNHRRHGRLQQQLPP